MSADKQTRALNRFHDHRVIRNQLSIWRMYNRSDYWLAAQKPSGFRKRKAMNCGCGTCRKYDMYAKHDHRKYYLGKATMKKEIDLGLSIGCEEKHSKSFWDVRPDIITKEWTDERPDICSNEEEWV